MEDCITKIVTHLCQNHRKHSSFHQTSCTEYAADQLISDALDFFRNGQFLADVVDLLMQITVDALNLELFIYQRNGDLTQVLHFKHPESDRIVRVKFTHDNLYPGGNHYDAVVCIIEPQMNLILISDVASKMAKIPSKPEANNFIDLTLSDEEDTEITHTSLTYDKLKDELESSDEEFSMHVEDKTSMISSPYVRQMPPLNKYLRPDPGQETSYSGTTESYSHSDETYVSTDVTDPEPNSSPASTPASTPELERRHPYPRTTSNRTSRHIQSSSATSSSASDAQNDLQDDDDFFMVDEFKAKTLTSQMSRGRPFPTWYFERTVAELVDAIPLDVDGTQLYQIRTTKNQLTKVTWDLRHFQMLTSSRERICRRQKDWDVPRFLCVPQQAVSFCAHF